MTYAAHKQKIFESVGASFWLRHALTSLEQRDPVDALNDARVLAELQRMRVRDVLAKQRVTNTYSIGGRS